MDHYYVRRPNVKNSIGTYALYKDAYDCAARVSTANPRCKYYIMHAAHKVLVDVFLAGRALSRTEYTRREWDMATR